MVRTGHAHTASELPHRRFDPRVIRRDHHVIQVSRHLRALIDVLHHRLSGKYGESFSRKSRGGKPGGNYTKNPRPHIRVYHVSRAGLSLELDVMQALSRSREADRGTYELSPSPRLSIRPDGLLEQPAGRARGIAIVPASPRPLLDPGSKRNHSCP